MATVDTELSSYATRAGVKVTRSVRLLAGNLDIKWLAQQLDECQGLLLSSGTDQPGRYTRWDVGFINPPLMVTARGSELRLEALNARGEVLVGAVASVLGDLGAEARRKERGLLELSAPVVRVSESSFAEEDRTRLPSTFSILRGLINVFSSPEDAHLGLYGALGYDLAFQLEPMQLSLLRPQDQRDIVLYLPDEILVVDHQLRQATRRSYDFEALGASTHGLSRSGARKVFTPRSPLPRVSDQAPNEYQDKVRLAKQAFACGDLFEVVLSQEFSEPLGLMPSEVFLGLRDRNPSPYGFLLNLGRQEYLIGASPEMYVRVEGSRVETCPISGTIPRGRDAFDDAEQIRKLLNSTKDECELTMCTDVDRNDKARICEPGSVRLLGRRLIETYSRLFHTVDHVEGVLREGFDGIDAFISHMWAVTVTGAPKRAALDFIERHERSARSFYGGAVGVLGFDGHVNTGLVIRTVHVKDGQASVRAGATLLADSDPDAEEAETRIKAQGLFDALDSARVPRRNPQAPPQPGAGKRILLVDHEDSFVHTLADYFRQTGAQVSTVRAGFSSAVFDKLRPHLVVLSPGPGRPERFRLSETLREARARDLPCFGVCLGLQGMVEFFGGSLLLLDTPMHGKPSPIRVLGGKLFEGVPEVFNAGRYHSLAANPANLPEELAVTARTEDGVIMAIEHTSLPWAALQFHPESIMTASDGLGLRIVRNAMAALTRG